MEIIKIELPLMREPKFFCPFTGYDLTGEELESAIDEGYLYLVVNWEDPDEYLMGDEDIMERYKKFTPKEDEETTERVARFLEEENLADSSFIIELTINAMACGPISDTNTFVFTKE